MLFLFSYPVSKQLLLDHVHDIWYLGAEPPERDLLLLTRVAASDGGRPGGEIAATEFDPHGGALQLPLVELEARSVLDAVVQPDTHTGSFQFVADRCRRLEDVGLLGL